MSSDKVDRVILRNSIQNEYDSYFDIIRSDGESFSNFIGETCSDGIYIDKYEGIGFNLNDIKKLLEFLGITYFESVKTNRYYENPKV